MNLTTQFPITAAALSGNSKVAKSFLEWFDYLTARCEVKVELMQICSEEWMLFASGTYEEDGVIKSKFLTLRKLNRLSFKVVEKSLL